MSVTLERLVKVFADPLDPARAVRAVDDVSLEIRTGELVTLLGPSGCGKTTVLRMVAGFETPTRGEVRLDGRVVTPDPPHRRNTAMVFQSYAIFPHLSVAENVAFGLTTRRVPAAEIARRVAAMLELVQLPGLGSRSPDQLSGGQQQRVALARAIITEPRVLLFDEPLSNLDAKLRAEMRGEIRAIQRRVGLTSLYVTHDQAEAMALSDRIVVMHAGRIEQVGTPDEIYARPATRFVADFVGRVNFLPAERVASGRVRVRLGETAVELEAAEAPPPPGGRGAADPAASAGGSAAPRWLAVLRPEAIRLEPQDAAPSGLPRGEVRRAVFLGPTAEYEIAAGPTTLLVSASDPLAARLHAEGATVAIRLPALPVALVPGEDA